MGSKVKLTVQVKVYDPKKKKNATLHGVIEPRGVAFGRETVSRQHSFP